jgi:carbonic anhydrase/acetyltransferase-like protein (isoleucine patch superfamily)
VVNKKTRWLAAAGFVVAVLAGATASARGQVHVDPTASIQGAAEHISFGDSAYVGPFASISARQPLRIGDRSSIRDNTTIRAIAAPVTLGAKAIVAHGAAVIARLNHPVRIGVYGACPGDAPACPAFVGFNARVEGIVEKDAMVLSLARVGPGVRIPSGRKVLAGANVTRQEEVEEKTAPVVEADRLFMDSMVEVNAVLARISGRGDGQVPAEGSVPTDGSKTGQEAAGTIAEMSGYVSFHAPGGCSLELGDGGIYGFHSVVHGGPTNFPRNDGNFTVTGRFLRLGDESVLYRSRVGDNVTIGYRSVVEQSDLPSGTVIGDRVVIIGNVQVGRVEW